MGSPGNGRGMQRARPWRLPNSIKRWAAALRIASRNHTDKLPRADALENFEYSRNEWSWRLDTVIDRHKNDHRNRKSGRVLLKLQVLVSCKENLKFLTCCPEQRTILQP